jgi:hypothetical protein
LLGEFPLDVVRIECHRCGRAGSYRRDGLVALFGVGIALPDLLMELAQCERRIRLETMRRAVYGLGRVPLVSEFGRGVPCRPQHLKQIRPERLWNGAVTAIRK